MHTPWGASQTQKKIAEGITSYSTASHGGYHVSEDRLEQMPSCIREIKPFAGTGWYEEDEDWSLVVLSFPDYFKGMDCYYALKAASRRLKNYTSTPQWTLAHEKADEFRAENADKYASGSSSWGSDGAIIWAEHMTTAARITVRFSKETRDKASDLPQFFTLPEAEALGAEITAESGYALKSA